MSSGPVSPFPVKYNAQTPSERFTSPDTIIHCSVFTSTEISPITAAGSLFSAVKGTVLTTIVPSAFPRSVSPDLFRPLLPVILEHLIAEDYMPMEGSSEITQGYLRDVRLETAASLLKNSALPIREVALRAGYHNSSHFYHLFEQRFGVSPSVYRKTNL